MSDVVAAKRALRERMRAERDALSPQVCAPAAARIAQQVLEHPAFQRARAVAAYLSIGAEVDTTAIVEATLAGGRTLSLPKVNKAARRLDLYRVTDLSSQLQPGVWGIREPDSQRCSPVGLESVDLIIVPGLAFDPFLFRIGYGGGYYDTLLAAKRADCVSIGIAFAQQVVERVPVAAHDQPLDVLITDSRVYSRGAP